MELSLVASRSGPPCCRADGILLHSAYDPTLEAERFLEANLKARKPTHFILVGACLDYLSASIRARFPKALILSVQLDAAFRAYEGPGADAVWYPNGDMPLRGFLSARLDEECSGGVAILEWPPALKAFPDAARSAIGTLREVLDELASSAATLKVQGRTWMRNACRSFLLAENAAGLCKDGAPIVVAAAGPSLGKALSALAPYRQRFRLFAVSSALAACRAGGFEPDLVVATDGGFYSRAHLFPLADKPCVLASPLSALPSAFLFSKAAILPLVQGNFPELELSNLLGTGIPLPSHGSVSGSALRLAALATTGPILAAGLDLASWDLISHARPHGFDALIQEGERREKPFETLLFARERPLAPDAIQGGPWRNSRSLSIYAAALDVEVGDPPFAGRTYRIEPSPVALSAFLPLPVDGLQGLFSGAALPESHSTKYALPPLAEREESLAAFLDACVRAAMKACEELSRGELPESHRAREMLKSIDLPDWAAANRAIVSSRDASGSAEALEKETLSFLSDLTRRLLPWTT
jgi:hypothetical protein